MMGMIAVDEPPEQALARLRQLPAYGEVDYVAQGEHARALRVVGAKAGN